MDDKDFKKFQYMRLAASLISFACVLGIYLRRKAGLIGGVNRVFLIVLAICVVLYVYAANKVKPIEDARQEAFHKKVLEEEKERKRKLREKEEAGES